MNGECEVEEKLWRMGKVGWKGVQWHIFEYGIYVE
jgi:hypothetical protein